MNSLKKVWTFLYTHLKELNFYTADSTDDRKIGEGRISTRIYIITLLLSLLILSIYTLTTYETRTIVIEKPSLHMYEQLSTQVGREQLWCPCNELAIDYRFFSPLKPTFHPICSSMFIEQEWFNFLKLFENITSAYEFAYNAYYQFQMIDELCKTARSAINDELRQLFATKWITVSVVPNVTIKNAIEQIVEERISTMIGGFRRSLKFGRLGSGYQSISMVAQVIASPNYHNVSKLEFAVGSSDINPNCPCTSQLNCKAHIIIIPDWTNNAIFSGQFLIPNLLTGCNFINSLMASSFDCFFNQSCLDIIQLAKTSRTQLRAMRPSALFPPNTTFQTIVDNMMVESWGKTFNYSGFYEVCKPASCSYTVTVHKDVIVLITTIIGLFGGLNAALNLIVPRVVKFSCGKGKDVYRRLRLYTVRRRVLPNLDTTT